MATLSRGQTAGIIAAAVGTFAGLSAIVLLTMCCCSSPPVAAGKVPQFRPTEEYRLSNFLPDQYRPTTGQFGPPGQYGAPGQHGRRGRHDPPRQYYLYKIPNRF